MENPLGDSKDIEQKSQASQHLQAARGIKALILRQVSVQLLTFAGGVVLARILSPADFGTYLIASFFVQTIAQFSNFGLSASLVQRRDAIEDLDLAVGFTVQLSVTLVLVGILLWVAPFVQGFYPTASPALTWLVRAVSISLLFSTSKTMSELQLERRLEFAKIARIEFAESLTFQAAAVGFALADFGVWSLVYALLLKTAVGALLSFWIAPFPLRLSFDVSRAKKILRFGMPYQFTGLLNSLNGWIVPVFVGPLVGPQGVGYLNWASSNGKKPLMLVDAVMRVAFPHFSRIQDSKDEVQEQLKIYLSWLLLPASMWFVLLATSAWRIVPIVYTEKWSPAVPALIVCAFCVIVDCISWLVFQTQSALGFVDSTVRVLSVRTIVHLSLGVLLVYTLGFMGAPIAYLIVYTASIPFMFSGLGPRSMRRLLADLLWITKPLLISLMTGFASLLVPAPRLLGVALPIASSMIPFFLLTWLFAPKEIRLALKAQYMRRFFHRGRSKV